MDFIKVQEHRINIDKDGFICLTDMAKGGKPQIRASDVIQNWLLTKTTMEFLTAWEVVNNPNFKTVESHGFIEKPERMKISNWIYDTGAIGIYSKLGVGGGTYAHKDIAFEFGAHISPMFKLHVIKEYQRLKEIETNLDNQDWQIRRMFSKENFFVMGDAVKNYKIPMKPQLPANMMSLQYAEECDAVNLALFGFTAATWRKYNVLLAAKNENVRFYASTNELNILSNLEAYNAVMIKDGLSLWDRTRRLTAMAREQLAILNIKFPMKSLKKATAGGFQALYQQDGIPYGMFPQIPFATYLEQKKLKAS